MCLMQTDFPVPEGPRIIEIWLSGRPRLRPFRTRLRPKALTTSMNSTASSAPCSRFLPVCHWYSSASACEPGSSWYACSRSAAVGCSCASGCDSCCSSPRVASQSRGSSGRSSSSRVRSIPASLPTYRCSRIGAPEDLRSDHADQVHHHRVQHHRLRRGRAHSHRASPGRIAVVAPHEHDHRSHRHALDEAVEQVGWVLEHPEDQEEAAGADLPDLLYHGQVAGEETGADGRDVHEREHEPGG